MQADGDFTIRASLIFHASTELLAGWLAAVGVVLTKAKT